MKSKTSNFLYTAALGGLGMLSAGAGLVAARSRRRSDYFRKKVVLVTGSSRGLGLALAEELARRGARIVLTARDAEELDRARNKLLEIGALRDEADVVTILADLRSPEGANRLVETANQRFGRIDVLINNAGIITVGPIQKQTVSDFHDVMDSNFFSAVHCTLAVLPQMHERRAGAIAVISSIGGKIAVPHLLPYTASKFAAVGFSEGLATELRTKGIRVTTVCPGLMRTGSHVNAMFTGDAAREYRWFSLMANLPGLSTSAARAARKIVDGIASGAAEVTISPDSFLAARFGSLSPQLTRGAMGLMHLLLPSDIAGESQKHRGAELKSRRRLSGEHSASFYNQTATHPNWLVRRHSAS
jgi:short-subunit dehydrogenase